MRKIYLLFTAFAFIAGLSTAKAETVSPYSYGFDGLDVSEHDFAPTGWNHIVDSYSGDYVSYTLESRRCLRPSCHSARHRRCQFLCETNLFERFRGNLHRD